MASQNPISTVFDRASSNRIWGMLNTPARMAYAVAAGRFGQSMVRRVFGGEFPAGCGNWLEAKMRTGSPALTDRLEINPRFLHSEPPASESPGGPVRDFVRLDDEFLDMICVLLRSQADAICRNLGFYFQIGYVTAEYTVRPSSWHQDGLAAPMKKLLIYPRGVNAEIGTTAFIWDETTATTLSGGAGSWVIFDQNNLLHCGIVPDGASARPMIDILLVPSLVPPRIDHAAILREAAEGTRYMRQPLLPGLAELGDEELVEDIAQLFAAGRGTGAPASDRAINRAVAWGTTAFDVRDLSCAFDCLTAAHLAGASDPSVKLILTRLLIALGRLEEAREMARWGSDDGAGVQGFMATAYVVKASGDPMGAANYCGRAAALDPDDPWVAEFLAMDAIESGQSELAASHCERLRASGKLPFTADLLTARNLRARGDAKGAEAIYRRLVSLAPDDADLHVELAGLLAAYAAEDAASFARRANQLDPGRRSGGDPMQMGELAKT